MQNPENQNLPFLTRNMLSYEQGVQFGLSVTVETFNDVNVFISGITKNGPFRFTHLPAGDGTIETLFYPVDDVPIFLLVTTGNGMADRGETYVSVRLSINNDDFGTLVSGYVTSLSGLAYPYGKLEDNTSGRGHFLAYPGGIPAAGAEVSVTVPDGQMWRIRGIKLQLTTSATVGDREVSLIIKDADQEICFVPAGDVQAASLTYKYVYNAAEPWASSKVGTTVIQNMPTDIVLLPGGEIKTSTTNIKAGDAFNVPYIHIERWLTSKAA